MRPYTSIRPDPVRGYADDVAFAPTDVLLAEEGAAPRQRKGSSKSWSVEPGDMYQGYEGLLVRTVLLRSDKYKRVKTLPLVQHAADAFWLCKHIGFYDVEHIVVLSLKSSGVGQQVTSIYEAAVGGENVAAISIRHAMKVPIITGASHIVLCHNHPGGDPTPSKQDIELTERLRTGLLCVGIGLLDHVVVGYNEFRSLLDMGLMPG